MIFESLIQSLALLLPLRESLLPTRFRQQCRRICVGFIPMVFSPIGFHRFRFETFQILLRSICDFDFSKLITRFQTRIWNPGENGSDSKVYRIENWLWPDLTHVTFDEDEPRRRSLHSPDWVLVHIGSRAVPTAVLSDLKKRVKFNSNYYSQIHNRLIIICIHIVYRRSLVFDQYFILLEILSTHSWWYWKPLFWPQIWVIRQRKLLNDGRESELSNILISMTQQDTRLSPTTSSSHLIKEVMPKAFWSLSSKLIANNKCVKEGHNRSHLLARKASNSRVTLHFPIFAYNGCFVFILYFVNFYDINIIDLPKKK